MKKFITAVLMALLCAALCVGAYAADEGFNASLDIEKGDNYIAVSVTDSTVLQEKQPKLLINCDASYDGALLLFDGKVSALAYDADKGGVSFTVSKGGNYYIVKDIEPSSTVAATCTKDGSATYTFKGESFVTVLEKLGHTPADAVRENEVAASCKAEGSYDEVVYCSVCDEELSRETKTTDKLGHTPADAVREKEVAASCKAEGSYDEVVYCSVCDKELSRETKTTDKLGHTPADAVRENEVAATYEKEGSYDEVIYCSVCDEELSRESKTIDKLTPPAEPGVPSVPSTPPTTTEKVENEDGSVTTTVTDNKTGTVTETTVTPEGVSGTVVTDKEGNVSEITAEIPAKADTSAPVTIPVEVKTKDEAEISVKTNSDKPVTVEIPVSDATTGTVAVIVDKDGNETVINKTVLTEDGIAVSIEDGATIKIVDNSKNFEDVAEDAWYAEAIDFASAREIVNGMGEDKFEPKADTTRAMVWTMLARLEGVDTSGGETWYEVGQKWAMEKGISDGTNANAAITREQLVTMLWRYLGEPEGEGDLSDFTDGAETSDWAKNAKIWALEVGLIQGMGDGTLNPGGNANRAQVAQIIMNLLGL